MSLKLPDSMPWQIYQAYFNGLHALFGSFKVPSGGLLSKALPTHISSSGERCLSEHIMRLKAHSRSCRRRSANCVI